MSLSIIILVFIKKSITIFASEAFFAFAVIDGAVLAADFVWALTVIKEGAEI